MLFATPSAESTLRIVYPLLAALAVAGCQPKPPVQIEPKPTATITTDSTTTSSTTTSTTTTTTVEEPYDCSAIPGLPATYHTLTNYSTSEDFDFDADGYAVAVYQGNLVGKNQNGDTKVVATGFGSDTAGTRTLSTGDFVVAKVGEGVVELVDGITGSVTTAMGGFSYPNGVEVDEFDNVYVADQNQSLLIRFNAYNPDDNEVIATGLNNPNGVILSPDGLTIYVGSFGGGVIYAVDKLPSGEWDEARVLFQSS